MQHAHSLFIHTPYICNFHYWFVSSSCSFFFRQNSDISAKAAQIIKMERPQPDVNCLPPGSFYVLQNGRVVSTDALDGLQTYHVIPRVLGGKGGFGSLLRSFRIYKSTNQGMCRDLSGRRLKDVDEEENLKKWIAKRADREKEKEQKRKQKYERLKAPAAKHEFADPEFEKQRNEILEKTEDAIEQAFTSSTDDGEGPSANMACSSPTDEQKNENGDEETVSEDDEEMDCLGDQWFVSTQSRKRKSPILTKIDESDANIKEAEIVVKERAPGTISTPPPIKKTKQIAPKIVKKEDEQKPVEVAQPPPPKIDYCTQPIDFSKLTSATDLLLYPLDHLKAELQARQLKCGGNLNERAERLWMVKDLSPCDYPKKLRAGK